MRIALGIEYNGSQFHGWQAQRKLRTVQGTVEQVISSIADHPIKIACAGRTDTGVHAIHQVAHFDTDAKRALNSWLFGGNSLLPQDVCIRYAQAVSDDFHARFSATARHYRYVIYNNAVRSSLYNKQATWQYRPLDHEAMMEAGRDLIGEHDFTSFRAVSCQSQSSKRNVSALTVHRKGDLVYIDVIANAFLHHMVRNIAGVLISIGNGRHDVSWAKEVLLARDRCLGGVTAPPYGLYLLNVIYPDEFSLPKVVQEPFFMSSQNHS